MPTGPCLSRSRSRSKGSRSFSVGPHSCPQASSLRQLPAWSCHVLSDLRWPFVSLLCHCNGFLALSPSPETFQAPWGDRDCVFFCFFISQAWNSHDNRFAPRNALFTHLRVNSCRMHVLGYSNLRVQRASHRNSRDFFLALTSLAKWSLQVPSELPRSLGSWQWPLCAEESGPVSAVSVLPARVLASCSGLGSELLGGIPSLALRGQASSPGPLLGWLKLSLQGHSWSPEASPPPLCPPLLSLILSLCRATLRCVSVRPAVEMVPLLLAVPLPKAQVPVPGGPGESPTERGSQEAAACPLTLGGAFMVGQVVCLAPLL